jgi:probable rRNA maturation factor
VVDEAQSRELNHRFRGKDSATNVLAFPDDNDFLDYDCLGDLVICAPLVAAEALQQSKPVDAHWAHLVVHGMLHLQGFVHQSEEQASSMEAVEIEILDTLGYANPYNV